MRYYYDCPIKAAYMEQYHGIKLVWNSPMAGQSASWDCMTDGTTGYIVAHMDMAVHIVKKLSNGNKIYIHPDSLPLLEPQDRDKLGKGGASLEVREDFYPTIKDAKKLIKDFGFIIERRNGLPFMWPESE